MAYNIIPDDEIAVESPSTEYLNQRIRDNPIGMLEEQGFYSPDSFEVVPGEIELTPPTEESTILSTSPIKAYGYFCPVNGTVRTKFKIFSSNGSYSANGQIYINDVAAGTIRTTSNTTPTEFIEDIIITIAPVKIQLYLWGSGLVEMSAQDFALYGGVGWQFVNEYIQ